MAQIQLLVLAKLLIWLCRCLSVNLILITRSGPVVDLDK